MKVQPAPEITNLDYTVDETNVNIRISLDGGAELSDFRWDYTETWEYHALFVPDLMYVPGQNSELPSKIYRKPTAEEDYYYCWNSKDGIEPCTASTSGQSENRFTGSVNIGAKEDVELKGIKNPIGSGCDSKCRKSIEHRVDDDVEATYSIGYPYVTGSYERLNKSGSFLWSWGLGINRGWYGLLTAATFTKPRS